MTHASAIDRLLAVMEKLRDPVEGCSWDRRQTYKTIVPYTLEEAYEVADAIDQEDFDGLKKELGDLLFQVVFYCQLAKEEARFAFDDVADAMVTKLVSRHPHVFDGHSFKSEAEFKQAWERKKQQEREEHQAPDQDRFVSILDDIPTALPALQKAQKMQKRAAAYGFDWDNAEQVWAKVQEEIAELETAMQEQQPSAIEDELGDVFFTLVNLSRHLGINPELAVRQANRKFDRRFRFIENDLHGRNRDIQQTPIEELESLWQKAKEDGEA